VAGNAIRTRPISVVGASIIGGDTVDHGLWVAFWFFLAQLNFVLGAINLVPLLPFDGGHIAIRGVREDSQSVPVGARHGGRGNPSTISKLMPATYVILIVVGGYMLFDRDGRPGEPDQTVPVGDSL